MKRLLLFLMISLVSAFSFAQILTKPDSTSSSNKPIQVFDDTGYNFGVKKMQDVKNIIKINPFMAIRGDIPVYYERALNKFLSAEVGLGLTLIDYTAIAFKEADLTNIKSAKPGFSFKAGLRFYPQTDDDAPSGIYLMPQFNHVKYNEQHTLPCYTITGSFDQIINVNRTYNDMNMIFGYNLIFDSNIVLDYYFGIGYRNRKFSEVTCSSDGLGNEVIKIDPLQENVPSFKIGVSIGFAF